MFRIAGKNSNILLCLSYTTTGGTGKYCYTLQGVGIQGLTCGNACNSVFSANVTGTEERMNQRLQEQIPFHGELKVSPWDSLLTEVRRSAYRTAWVDDRVETEAQAERDLAAQAHDWDDPEKLKRVQLAQSRELREWVRLSREERSHGAQVARAAVSAGLSERYIESVQAEAKMIASVLSRALDAAQLSDGQREAAHGELRVALAEVGRELTARHQSIGASIPERPALDV